MNLSVDIADVVDSPNKSLSTEHPLFHKLVLIAVYLLTAPTCSLGRAAFLYGLNVQGPDNLLAIDQQTGSAARLASFGSLGPGSWNGLTDLPGDSSVLFAPQQPTPAGI